MPSFFAKSIRGAAEIFFFFGKTYFGVNHDITKEFAEEPSKEKAATERALPAHIQFSKDSGSEMQSSVWQSTILIMQYLEKVMNCLVEEALCCLCAQRIHEAALQIRGTIHLLRSLEEKGAPLQKIH